MEKFLKIGVIANTHGIKGEVKVFPTTDDNQRFKKLKECILDTGKEKINLEVTGCKFFKQMVILKFKDIDDINQIERYKGCDLFVSRENAVKLNKDEYFIADIVGSLVVDEENITIGKLSEVMQTGANDVYVVIDEEGKETLIPVIKQCVLNVDVENKKIVVHLLKGM